MTETKKKQTKKPATKKEPKQKPKEKAPAKEEYCLLVLTGEWAAEAPKASAAAVQELRTKLSELAIYAVVPNVVGCLITDKTMGRVEVLCEKSNKEEVLKVIGDTLHWLVTPTVVELHAWINERSA